MPDRTLERAYPQAEEHKEEKTKGAKMSRKTYPKYKPSGIEWLGDVPEHWEVKRAKTILARNDSGVWGEDFDEDGIIVLRSTEQTVDGNWNIANPAKRKLSTAEFRACHLLKGDLIVTKSSGSQQHIGKTSIVTKEVESLNCCCSNFMQRLRVKQSVSPRFVWYVLNGEVGRSQFNYYSSTTTGLANLNGPIIGNVHIAIPHYDEQLAISGFLDHEAARVDSLIQKKQRQIELLNEKRSALISHAVTRGLDPNVPMKDSGVEWLGKIPEHWTTRRIKHLSLKIGSGKTPRGGAETYVDSGVLLLRSQNIHFRGVYLDSAVYISHDVDNEMPNTRVMPNDVLLNITGASLGRASLVPEDMPRANVNQHVCIIRPKRRVVIPQYVFLAICSQLVQSQIFAAENGTSREGLNFEQVGDLLIAFPSSLAEQERIAGTVFAGIYHVDSIVAGIQRSIDLLREYRVALISAAVTGKIDVRRETSNVSDLP